MARLGDHSPALGAHLEQRVRTGTFCSYALAAVVLAGSDRHLLNLAAEAARGSTG